MPMLIVSDEYTSGPVSQQAGQYSVAAVRLSTFSPPTTVRKVWSAAKSPTKNVTVCPGIKTANGRYFPSSTWTEATSTPFTKALTTVPSGAGKPSIVTAPTNMWGGRFWLSWSKSGVGVGGGSGVGVYGTIPAEILGVAVAVGASVGVGSGVAVGSGVGVGSAVGVGIVVAVGTAVGTSVAGD